jgi:hypothetical protein
MGTCGNLEQLVVRNMTMREIWQETPTQTQYPLLKIRMYQVTFFDGNIRDFAANTIAKAIYTRHDDEGNQVYTNKGDH